MSKAGKASIDVQGTAVTVLSQSNNDYISLTDIAKHMEACFAPTQYGLSFE